MPCNESCNKFIEKKKLPYLLNKTVNLDMSWIMLQVMLEFLSVSLWQAIIENQRLQKFSAIQSGEKYDQIQRRLL